MSNNKTHNHNPNGLAKLKPLDIRVGDIFFHGQTQHPAVILKRIGDEWLCLGLTTEQECPALLGQMNTRYKGVQYITSTIIKASESQIINQYRGNVSNREVKRLKSLVVESLKTTISFLK